MNITYRASGLKETIDSFSQWEKAIEKGDGLDEVSAIILRSTMENYRQKRDSRAWPKRVKTVSWPILLKTGDKRRTELSSITERWQKTGTGFQKRIESMWYGLYHQEGTNRMPSRKSIYFQTHIEQEIEKALIKQFGFARWRKK